MRWQSALACGAMLIFAALVSFSCDRGAPPLGYQGQIPSPAAQMALKALSGQTAKDKAGAEWKIVGFMVGPSGPVVKLSRPGQERSVPVETDGDAADFVERVTGTRPEGLPTTLGEKYTADWPR